MSIFVLYGSSRRNGNSEKLAEKVIAGLSCSKVYLQETNIQAIEDKRHDPEGFQVMEDDYDDIVESMLNHDILLFVTPLYWYGMSGQMKNFFDRWSQSLRDKHIDFKERIRNKKAYVVISGGDHPRVKGLPLVQQFQFIFDFVSIDFGGYIIGEGNQPEDILQDKRAMLEAEQLNRELSR